MIQSTIKNNNGSRPSSGANRCIRDAMDLYGLDMRGLADLLKITEEKCRKMMDQELIILAKMAWITSILKYAYGDIAPRFLSLKEAEDFLRQIMEARGPEWMEEPPIIEGSSRYLHQQIQKIKCAGQQNNKDQQKEVKND